MNRGKITAEEVASLYESAQDYGDGLEAILRGMGFEVEDRQPIQTSVTYQEAVAAALRNPRVIERINRYNALLSGAFAKQATRAR